MAYAIGDFVEADDPGGSSVTTLSAPSFTPAAGSALVCFVWYLNATSRTVTLADTAGGNDSWTEAGTGIFDAGEAAGLRAFVLHNCAATATTVQATFSDTVTYPCITVIEVSGIATSDAIVGQAGATQAAPGTGSNAISTGNTGTLTNQPAALIGCVQNLATSSTPALGTDYAGVGIGWDYGGATAGMRVEHKRVTVTTADDATWTDATNGGTATYQSYVVALAEAGTTQSNAPRAAHLMKLMGAM